MKNNEIIYEGKTYLQVYLNNHGSNYPYNYTIIKGNELYFVSYRRGKPFLYKYKGKISSEYRPVGQFIHNPSKALIMLLQTKLNSINNIKENNSIKLFKEFNESDDLSGVELDKISFFNKLKEGAEKLLKKYPNDFQINLVPGKILTIGTTNINDLRIVIKASNDKINFIVTPTSGPNYEFSYGFDKNGIQEIIGLIDSAFKEDPNQGLEKKPSKEKYPADTSEPSKNLKEEEIEPLDIPITNKPKKRKRSIDINIIQDVLEDAYILDDIDLKNISVKELVRRMLYETRRKTYSK